MVGIGGGLAAELGALVLMTAPLAQRARSRRELLPFDGGLDGVHSATTLRSVASRSASAGS